MFIIGIGEVRQHPDCKSVWVTPYGDVYRRINKNHPERRQWLKYRPDVNKDGYLRLRVDGGKFWFIHRLVYFLYVGKLDENLVVCHLDGIVTNNHKSNLIQATQQVNMMHKKAHGTHQIGEKHGRSLYDDHTVLLVHNALQNAKRTQSGRLVKGEALRIAKEHGVSKHLIYDLKKERRSVVC